MSIARFFSSVQMTLASTPLQKKAKTMAISSSLIALAAVVMQVAAAKLGLTLISGKVGAILWTTSFTLGGLAISQLLVASVLAALVSGCVFHLAKFLSARVKKTRDDLTRQEFLSLKAIYTLMKSYPEKNLELIRWPLAQDTVRLVFGSQLVGNAGFLSGVREALTFFQTSSPTLSSSVEVLENAFQKQKALSSIYLTSDRGRSYEKEIKASTWVYLQIFQAVFKDDPQIDLYIKPEAYGLCGISYAPDADRINKEIAAFVEQVRHAIRKSDRGYSFSSYFGS